MISIILPVYRNADFLVELIDRLHRALDAFGIEHEIIGVNDCCPGASLEVLRSISSRDPRLVVVNLKRNRGQHRAVLSGLTCASGDWFATMDADLQDPPEIVPRLLDIATANHAVVFAGRRGLYQSLPRMITSKLFKTLLAVVAGIPRDAGMFFVAPAEAKETLLGLKTGKPFIVAMLGRVAVRKISHPVERSRRPSGTSSYSSRKRLEAGLGAVWCALQCRLGVLFRERPDYAENVETVTRGKDSKT